MLAFRSGQRGTSGRLGHRLRRLRPVAGDDGRRAFRRYSRSRTPARSATPNLQAAGQMIEILGMLQEKTKGNLPRPGGAAHRRSAVRAADALRPGPGRREAHHSPVAGSPRASVALRLRRLTSGARTPFNLEDHIPRNRHLTRRADDRLRLRDLPLHGSQGSAAAHVGADCHRRRRPAARGRRTRPARPGAGARHPARRRHPVHARPRRSHPRAGRSPPLQHPAAQTDGLLRRRCTRWPTSAARSRTSSSRRATPAAAVPEIELFAHRRSVLRRPAGGAAREGDARRAADPGVSAGRLRLSDRLQRDSGRVVAAARGPRCPGAGRAAHRSRTRRTFRCPRRSRRRAASRRAARYFTHICARSAPRRRRLRALPPGMELAYDGLMVECA